MINNTNRIGKFTSSEIFKLFESNKVRNEYLREKQIERRLQRPIKLKSFSRSMAWGEIVEQYVFRFKVGTQYELCSDITTIHPEYNFWAGSPDLKTIDSVADIKCFEPKNFANYADVILSKDIEKFRKEFPKEYWQLVSNACILDKKYIEPILYLPYLDDISDIQVFVNEFDGEDMFRYKFIVDCEPEELPYQMSNDFYTDIIQAKFEVPIDDKSTLIYEVTKANELI